MPHILADGCHNEKMICEINIHAEIKFSRIAWAHRAKADLRVQELREKIEALLMEYFEMSEITSDIHSNHEYNTRMNNF